MIVKLEAVTFALARASLMRSTTDLRNPLNRPIACRGDTSWKLAAPTAYLTGSSETILANALVASEQEGVVDLLPGELHPMRKPLDDVLGVVGVDPVYVLQPRLGKNFDLSW